jgi:hypothetical protein
MESSRQGAFHFLVLLPTKCPDLSISLLVLKGMGLYGDIMDVMRSNAI